ncbi:MAG: Unknown protein [uncultured Sulfurovum sp.]|uniref:Uncharacterized protein n=1 Tax=uncultured Sulfurovum sp. TaxID=269237 RepID=A0A6S6SUM8_9BACT|nr:MAG: Unknown protein [uncultured Sulfurovum sp.]
MKLDVIANGKRGVINITSEQFIIEDLKTHVCKKLELIESDFKVKVSCGDSPSIELVKVPSLSFNQKENLKSEVEVINAYFSYENNVYGDLCINICSSVDDVLPDRYHADNNGLSYILKCNERVVKLEGYNGHWIEFMKNTEPNKIIDVFNNANKLLYKIRIIRRPPRKCEGCNDKDYREWREKHKEFLRIFWSGREMNKDEDIFSNTPIYVTELNMRSNDVDSLKGAYWSLIAEYRKIFVIGGLYITLKGTEVFISSELGAKEKIFDMNSADSIKAFMKREI